MIAIKKENDGFSFSAKVRPGARKNEISGIHDECLKIKVTAAPEKGKANKAIIALLAKEMNIPKSRISILNGETSSLKKIFIKEVDPEKLLNIITKTLS